MSSITKPLRSLSFGGGSAVSPAKQSLYRLIPWVLFVTGASLLLRPILLTNISADDFINPFSQIYHAGTSIDAVMKRTWDIIPKTGHFNYVGQSIGSVIVMIWTYLIGNFGIRYSLVYSVTKFLVYLICILVGAATIRTVLNYLGVHINKWPPRIALLLILAASLQIHIPWSNDPVASYPLAGFLTVAIGLGYIALVIQYFESAPPLFAFLIGIYGALNVLYYEFNSFAVCAVAPVLVFGIWKSKTDRGQFQKRMTSSFLLAAPAAFTTIFFYFRNQASVEAYAGTSISLKSPFLDTYSNGLASSLPATGWNISHEWLTGSLNVPQQTWMPLTVGLILISFMVFFHNVHIEKVNTIAITPLRVLVVCSPFVLYWAGATFTQASTLKVQMEAVRLGQVYNYYAVGATCFALLLVIGLFLINWSRVHAVLQLGLFAFALLFGAYQYIVNWNVMVQFNGATSGGSQLLVAFAERPPMPERCNALNVWKSVGWPEYYWLDMELGLNQSYKIYHGEPFCEQ
jgi:hypothetical protein